MTATMYFVPKVVGFGMSPVAALSAFIGFFPVPPDFPALALFGGWIYLSATQNVPAG